MNVLYLLGDNRSGSTMLMHLLSLQQGAYPLGEVRRFGEIARSDEPCACGELVIECGFWQRQIANMGAHAESLYTEVPRTNTLWRQRVMLEAVAARLSMQGLCNFCFRDFRRAAAQCASLYHAVQRETGAKLLIDSSKNPDQFIHLWTHYRDSITPVILARDGRAIVWSMMRRVDAKVDYAIDAFLWTVKLMRTAIAAIPPAQRRYLRYEDLCRDPHGELVRILDGTGIDVSSVDLGTLPDERHDLGGSPGFKGKSSGGIKLDERWRDEMPSDVLNRFEQRAGKANQLLGYL
ncbi:MAG: sulfotransferase [Pseudomonadota bacterium]